MVIGWGCRRQLEMSGMMLKMSYFIVGNNKRVKFWEDRWSSDMTLVLDFQDNSMIGNMREWRPFKVFAHNLN